MYMVFCSVRFLCIFTENCGKIYQTEFWIEEGDSLSQSRQKDIVNIVEKNTQKAECFVIWQHVRKEKSDWNEKA